MRSSTPALQVAVLLLPTVLGFSPFLRLVPHSTCLHLSTRNSLYPSKYPPPPPFNPKPLPVLLGGGLFLFATSVKPQNKPFAEALLQQAQTALRQDATIGMELGQGVETGGIYASQFCSSSSPGGYDQLVLQFQIEGGNAWAQGVAYGVRNDNRIQLVSLEVANMDASINGTPFEITIPFPEENKNDIDSAEDQKDD